MAEQTCRSAHSWHHCSQAADNVEM